MKNTPQPRRFWPPCLAILVLLGGIFPASSSVFDFSPQLRDVLVTEGSNVIYYRVWDPVKGKYVSEDEGSTQILGLGVSDGIVHWTDGVRVFCRVYDTFEGRWKKTSIVAGDAMNLASQSGITTWTSAGFVYLLVYDASRGIWIDDRIAFSGEPQALMTQDGVVAWLNQTAAFYAVYDPILGSWEGDLESTGAPPAGLNIQDGVVSWHNGSTVYCRTYDPVLGDWQGKKVTSGSVENLMSDGGVVAWSSAATIYYIIYDPTRETWKNGDRDSGVTDNLTLTDGTVRWTSGVPGEDDFIRGYDVISGTWGSQITTPLALFIPSSTDGEAPLRVYFIDMSFGATGWCWEFEGYGASTRRSPFRNFTNAVPSEVTLTVTDPIDRSDTRSRTITPGGSETAPAFSGASVASAQVVGPVTDTFHTSIIGAPGQVVTVEISPNTTSWSVLTMLTNTTGKVEFVDAETSGARYYRLSVSSGVATAE